MVLIFLGVVIVFIISSFKL